MIKKTFTSKFNSIDNLNQCPLTSNENRKLKNNKGPLNLNYTKHILKKRHSQNKISFQPSKSKMTFNQSFVSFKLQSNNHKLKLLKFDKKENFNSKLKRLSSNNLIENKKIRHFSQLQNNQSGYINKKIKDKAIYGEIDELINNKKEEKENEDIDIDVNQLMEKINKEFSDIGKLIRVNFIIDNNNKYTYDKNEHVILKIIANDLNENQGINAKEFFYNDKKLNIFKSLKDNNIKNNSIIKIII